MTPAALPLAAAGRAANPETRFDRGAALVLAASLAILALPADGWQVPGANDVTQFATFYGDWPTPLQAGDEVLTVNGLNVDSANGAWLSRYDLPAWRAGSTVTYTIRRGSQTLSIPVTLHQPAPADIARALADAARVDWSEWSWLLTALVVFGLRPGNHTARLLLVTMVSHAAAIKLGWAATIVAVSFAPPLWFAINLLSSNFWLWLFWPTILWMVLSFPRPLFPLARWPRATLALVYGLPIACFVASLLTTNLLPFTAALIGELAALAVVLVGTVVHTYRHSEDAVARAQVAWMVLGFAVSLGAVLASYLIEYLWPSSQSFFNAIPGLLPLVLPICLAIAITRYRLWDIDVVIRRTLIYGLLTALLAGVYFGSVVVLEAVFTLLTGASRSELVTVLSTLAIAALFVPLRRRLQAFIDRRFFRRKYDTARTLAAFSARLRNEVDLPVLTGHLLAVVDETMQPASVWLWLPDKVKPSGPSQR